MSPPPRELRRGVSAPAPEPGAQRTWDGLAGRCVGSEGGAWAATRKLSSQPDRPRWLIAATAVPAPDRVGVSQRGRVPARPGRGGLCSKGMGGGNEPLTPPEARVLGQGASVGVCVSRVCTVCMSIHVCHVHVCVMCAHSGHVCHMCLCVPCAHTTCMCAHVCHVCVCVSCVSAAGMCAVCLCVSCM